MAGWVCAHPIRQPPGCLRPTEEVDAPSRIGGGAVMMPFSDDDLEQFYRGVEARTDLTPRRRRRPAPVYRDCPTPYKDAFGSEAAAIEGIGRIRQVGRRAPTLRCYRCDCESWHITSSPPREEPPRPPRGRRGRHRR
ncbi:hypothetical protein GPOL_c24250 [Gordonia polyisoprenivorans VH2]|uniref:Uncharacterized protein n=2 Tax=Gordonia polyisoprenivorans TaxID=84595 RepID=H6N2M9_GORPV|nr:hypothetical protein GPOL_c24250 [Gordonia polyisoprenivorans VH2]